MEIDIKITDDSGRVHHKQFTINNKKPHKSIQQNKNVKSSRKKPTVPSRILELVADGYLDQYRTTTELIVEFKRRTYNFRSDQLSHPLRRLSRNEKLRRKANTKKKSTWLYKKW